MEDEQGGFSPVTDEGVSELPVNVTLSDETLAENIGAENQTEYHEEGDGGEIMVEVLGSDVFVDGVSSSNKEGDFMSADIGSLGSDILERREEIEIQKLPDATAFLSNGDENKLVESELDLSVSGNEHTHIVPKEAEGNFFESFAVCAMSSLEAKPGIEAMTMTSSATTQSMAEQTEGIVENNSVVVMEETGIEDETASIVNASAKDGALELLGDHVEASLVGEIGMITEESAIKGEGVDCNSATANNEDVEHLSDPDEDFAVEEIASNAASHDVMSLEDIGAAANDRIKPTEVSVNPIGECLDSALVVEVDGVVGSVTANTISPVDHNLDTVDPTCGGEESLTTASIGDGASGPSAESANPTGDYGIDEKVVIAPGSKDLIQEPGGQLSDIKDGNRDCVYEVPGTKCEETEGVDNASHVPTLVSEREEAMEVDLDDLDFKDEQYGVNKFSGGNNSEILTSGSLETGMVLQNNEFSSQPTQLAGPDENMAPATSSISPGENEHAQADAGTYIDQPVIATPVDEATNDQNVEVSQLEVVNADGTSEKDVDTDTDLTEPLSECQGTSNIPELDTPTETLNDIIENHVAENNPVVNAEVGQDNLVEECGSPQRKDVDVFTQKIETPIDEMDVLEDITLLPNDVTDVAAVFDKSGNTELLVSCTDISLPDGVDIQETSVTEVDTSNDEINESRESEENSGKSCEDHVVESHTSEARLTDVEEETELDQEYHQGEEVDDGEPESGNDEPASETGKKKLSKKGRVKSPSVVRMSQPGYLSAPEKEGEYEVSDLVWGKVKSHPWWPGQIFDPEDASDKAVKHSKKDSYLVAYFGDRTFAWNDASFLKPFWSQFSWIEKQSTSETFQNAVSCALEEVSRRVELGFSCSCIPKDAYSELATQVVDNAGIRKESSRRNGVDQSCRAIYFEPDGLLQFVRDLASRASCGADRLDFAIVKAQLSAFCRFKGYRLPTAFPLAGQLLEHDAEPEQLSSEFVYSHKSKRVSKDNLQASDDMSYSPDGEDDESIAKDVFFTSGKKRKAVDPLPDGSDKRANVYSGQTLASTNQNPKPSFKIGECIRRVASQLTGSTSATLKAPNDEVLTNGSPKIDEHSRMQRVVVSAESSFPIEMLSQLQLVAHDPNKQHEFRDEIITFFTGFRSSVVVNKRVRKKKADKAIGGSAEDFEFDDVSDSYWTDRVVQNYTEKQLLHSNENREVNLQLALVDIEKSVKSGGKSNSRKRFYYSVSGSRRNASEESGEKVKRVKQESAEKVNRVKQETSPAELILNFADRKSIPSEINLNKTFRRFGPLMESETEVDHESGRAKVIFKRGSDAEVAHNSSQKFNIFGSVIVTYEIGYSPLISVKILPVALPQFQEDATLMQ